VPGDVASRAPADADHAYVQATLRGDLRAFEALVERHRDVVVRVAARIVGREEAEDVSQDAFLRAFHRLPRFRADASFRAWLLQIAHNAAIDHLRRVGAARTEDLEVETEGGRTFEKPLASRSPTPEQETERGERRAEIEEVVCRLQPAYRELIVLRHSHDLSYDEIAEVTGLPLGTVKNRIFRAREAMRELLIARGITGV
jgi:RNA polymerase sigma-70 factor (ECF subfamily)